MNKKREGKTFVEHISIFGLTARVAALALQTYAADFLAAAKAIPPPSVPFAPARPYLACHALELALKAFLSLKGYSFDRLAGGEFSHRLANLIDEAEQNGLYDFVSLKEDETSQIRFASDYYSSKVFEYPAAGELLRVLPGMPDIKISDRCGRNVD